MVPPTPDPIWTSFVEGTLDLDVFDHRSHLVVAYGYLVRGDFLPAAADFETRLRRYLKEAGVDPHRYHATLTLAFLALVHERMILGGDEGGFEPFLEANPDLLEVGVARRRWGPALDHPLARRHPLMPGVGDES